MFITRVRASADRSPWGDFWFTPVGGMTAAGARVTAEGALALPTAWACVRNISEDFAKLPFRLYQPRDGGGRDPITDHWLYRLFARRPNAWQTPFEWREMLQGHLLLRGNAYNRIVANGRGEITDLVPMHPDRTKIELLDSGNFRYRYTDGNGNLQILRRDEVWHLRALSPDGILGYSPIEVQRQALGAGLSAQAYAARFFANDAKPSGGWIEFPGSFADAAARRTFQESWQDIQGGANRGKVAVLDKGMQYHEIGLNNKDSQFIETQQNGAIGVCSMFRMPPHKVGILDKATFSNIEQQNIEYATDTQHSWCERWESSIESALLDPDTDLEVEFDLRILMRGDSAARAKRAVSLVSGGILTRNEARDDEGYNPLDGLDEPLRPLNMVEESDAETAENAGPPGAPVPTAPADDDEPAARLRAMIRSSAGRVARRIQQARSVGDKEVELLAETMAVSLATAVAWRDSIAGREMTEIELTASIEQLAPSLRGAGHAGAGPVFINLPKIDVHAPITNTPPAVSMTAPTHIAVHVPPHQAVTKTVVTERLNDGTLVSRVKEE